MSREDYELLKQLMEWKDLDVRRKDDEYVDENEDLVIEENTIYEIDMDCYECLMREKRKLLREGEQHYYHKEVYKKKGLLSQPLF